MKKTQDIYGEPIIFTSEKAVIKVYRPILTEEERARRMKLIKKAAAELLISVEKSKKQKDLG